MADYPADDRRGAARRHDASRPGDSSGWKDFVWNVWQAVSEGNIFLIAGGVTYATLLALFPSLAAMVAIYGLLLDPMQIEQQVGALAGVLPEQSLQMLAGQLHELAAASGGALGFGAAAALLFALWSASRGMSGMITALDIAYETRERRGFLRFNLLALVLTLGGIFAGLIAVALIAVLPAAIQFVGLDAKTKWLILVLEWPFLIAVVMLCLAVLYRFAPDHEEPRWRWISPGAATATLLWIAASIGFTAYVSNFGSYEKTYGTLGGVVILLTWLYLTTFVVLLGAVINAQAERLVQPRPSASGRNLHHMVGQRQ